MRIAVMGAGGVGGYFGARLAHAGHDVAFIARGVVVPFQNGVESIERIGAVLGREPVMGGAAYIAATIAEPGVIAHTGTMARLQFGAVLPAQHNLALQLHEACKAAGIDAEIAEDILKTLWIKFGFLAALSGMTAATRQPIGVIRADPDLRATFEAAIREVWELARARRCAARRFRRPADALR